MAKNDEAINPDGERFIAKRRLLQQGDRTCSSARGKRNPEHQWCSTYVSGEAERQDQGHHNARTNREIPISCRYGLLISVGSGHFFSKHLPIPGSRDSSAPADRNRCIFLTVQNRLWKLRSAGAGREPR